MSTSRYFLGLDLGEKRDYTALAVLRQQGKPTGQTTIAPVGWDLSEGLIYDNVPVLEYRYDVIHLDRWRGRGYHEVVPIVSKVLLQLHQLDHQEQLERFGRSAYVPEHHLLVDNTGVGIAVVDSLRTAGLDCVAVTTHGGDTVSRREGEIRVPKRELVGALNVLLQTKRLGISGQLELADALTAELENFRAKVKLTTGHDTYGAGMDWRENNHDDLVLALAMAAWYGEDQASQPRGVALGLE